MAELLIALDGTSLGLGKTKAPLQWQPQELSDKPCAVPRGDVWRVVLQTPACLHGPAKTRSNATDRIDALHQDYDKYWSDVIGCGVKLVNFMARQRLAGGYLARRYPVAPKIGFKPYLLTEPGSIFILKASDESRECSKSKIQKKLNEIAIEGLPLSSSWPSGQRDWRNHPFLPTAGWGRSAHLGPRSGATGAIVMSGALGFVRFEAVLQLETDLHIGNGDEVPRKEEGEPFSMATVVRDACGKPVIPGTALKGVLRAAIRVACNEEEAGCLFGSIKESGNNTKSSGQIGAVTLYAARQCKPGSAPDLPTSGKQDTAMATHVALGRKYGVAEPQKLFYREIVPAGAQFRLEGVARGSPAALGDIEKACDNIRKALKPLRTGVSLGRGTAKGNGRLKLVCKNVKIVTRSLDVSKQEAEIVNKKAQLRIPKTTAPQSVRRVHFELSCPGPFLSHDPSRNVTNQDNVLFALRRNANQPILWPESLYGVLRERCAWLASTDSVGDGGCDDEQRFRPLPTDNPCQLARTGRLFGVPGWRSLVRIGALDLSGGCRRRTCDTDNEGGFAGITIDRFSGAVLDSGPFFSDAWVGLTLTFTLVLEARGKFPKQDDCTLFRRLVEYISIEGLLLGHGVSRGYGWFDPVKVEEVS